MIELATELQALGDETAAHLLLSLAALALGVVLALLLTWWASRNRLVSRVALGLASLIQTIPALALLALFYPVLLAVSALVGGRVSALGFLPALLALALYAVLPILRNGVTGLATLDPAAREAADAMGMTRAQKLRWVEAPLVAPAVIAGIRTAAVWTIGAATLATTVGATSLGNPIFAGLQTQDWVLVTAGCLAAAALALGADATIALIERGVATRRPALAWAGVVVIALGLAWSLPSAGAGSRPVAVVGAKNFSEQYVLAALMRDRLTAAGFEVDQRQGLGSAVIFAALESGAIDAYVDYAGTLWTNELERNDNPAPEAMRGDIDRWLGSGGKARLVGSLGFENAYAFAMPAKTARRLGIATLDDLAARSPKLVLGTDLEFLKRPEWALARAAYPFRFASTRSYAPTFMYRALGSGGADVITAYTSDGRIAADGLTVIADPRRAVPNYDALLLVSARCAALPRCIGALRPLAGRIPVEAMREANYRVDRDADKQTPAAAARWLAAKTGLAR